MKYDYQLAVIGAGSGGLSMVSMAASLGFNSVALVEKDSRLGGECLHTGCVPSKALLHASSKGLKNPWNHVRRSIKTIEDHSDNDKVIEKKGIDVLHGDTRFVDANTLQVGNKTIQAKYFVIAIGSSPFVPPIPGLENVEYRTNETIFDLKEAPKTLTIIGGGPIGSEMATAFADLGTKVTILDRGDRLLSREHKDASAAVQRSLEQKGVKIMTKVGEYTIKKRGTKKVLEFADGTTSLSGDELLLAIGRTPHTDINLEAAGVEYDKTGILINDSLRTTQKNIYAIGDCTPSPKFTHLAGHQAAVVIQNLLIPIFKRSATHLVPTPAITYTAPEVGSFGRSVDSCNDAAGERVMNQELSVNDRAITDEGTDGFVRILIDKKGRLLGGTVVAANASELLSPLLILFYKKLSITNLGTTVIPYPTLASILSNFAGEYVAQKTTSTPGWKLFTRNWYR